jgi:large subunit ribosomal protein L6
MSRKGNKPIIIPEGINVEIKPLVIDVISNNNKIAIAYDPKYTTITKDNNSIIVTPVNKDDRTSNILHGTISSHLINAFIGLTKSFTKKLKISGVGYKANIVGDKLNLSIGFSHPIIFTIPKNLNVSTPTNVEICISGINKQEVGQFAAVVRGVRPPEPYNGKGIMYDDEIIIRKVGKTAEGAGATTGGAGGGKK